MGNRIGHRAWLAAANLVLLLAALPTVGRSEESQLRRVDRGSDRPAPRAVEEPSSGHQPAQPTRGTDSSSGDGHRRSSGDDGDGEAGRLAGACCAGFVGAVADSAANDPSDVDYQEPEPAPPPPISLPPRVEPPAAAPPPPGPFDVKAAKASLRQASRQTAAQCETEQELLGDYTAKVTFAPDGRATAAELDPGPVTERLAECAGAIYLRAQVPPFQGDETVVKMAFSARAADPAAAPAPEPTAAPASE